MQIFKKFNIWRGNQLGISLIETAIALALLGIIAPPFLGSLATASKAAFISDEQATAESIARSQMEYTKGGNYIDYAEPGHDEYGLILTPSNYSIELTVLPIDSDTGQVSEEDEGIQKITVMVKHNDEYALTLDNYKVDR